MFEHLILMNVLCLLSVGYFLPAVTGVVSTGRCLGFSASNTKGAVQNYVNCDISVQPGDMLRINTCNTSTLSGDTYLRLFDPTDKVELTHGDDGCRGSAGTDLTYEVPIAYPNSGVTLHLHQGCFSTLDCGGVSEYTLNVEASPASRPTAAPADDDRLFKLHDCPLQECLDENHPERGWNQCDMCVCRDFDKIFLSVHDHDCNAHEALYMCMVKYDVKTVTCTTEMKPGWVAAFFFIGFCGFVCFAGGFGYVLYLLCCARPNKPIRPMPDSPPGQPTAAAQRPGSAERSVEEAQQLFDDEEDPAIAKERAFALQAGSSSAALE